MVRGLAEISRFAMHFGADKETLSGLSGMGDLITTCSSTISRNHYVGENLGKGKIGLECFRYIMNDDRFDEIPMVLETVNPEIWPEEIALLYSMQKN